MWALEKAKSFLFVGVIVGIFLYPRGREGKEENGRPFYWAPCCLLTLRKGGHARFEGASRALNSINREVERKKPIIIYEEKYVVGFLFLFILGALIRGSPTTGISFRSHFSG